jgi:hypothetical protein
VVEHKESINPSVLIGSFLSVTALAIFGAFATFAPEGARPSYWVMTGSVALAFVLVGSLFWAPRMLRRWAPDIATPFMIAWGTGTTLFAGLLVATSLVFGLVLNSPEWDKIYAWTVVFECIALAGTLVVILVAGQMRQR